MKELRGGPLDGLRVDWSDAFVAIQVPSDDARWHKYTLRLDRYMYCGVRPAAEASSMSKCKATISSYKVGEVRMLVLTIGGLTDFTLASA